MAARTPEQERALDRIVYLKGTIYALENDILSLRSLPRAAPGVAILTARIAAVTREITVLEDTVKSLDITTS